MSKFKELELATVKVKLANYLLNNFAKRNSIIGIIGTIDRILSLYSIRYIIGNKIRKNEVKKLHFC